VLAWQVRGKRKKREIFFEGFVLLPSPPSLLFETFFFRSSFSILSTKKKKKQFCLMHFVEVRRWVDIRKHGSANDDPIFKGNRVPNAEPGYPGGIFDPLGFSKGNFKELQTKEIKNGRLAMIAFMGFIIQAQATGEGPLANLGSHLSSPFEQNWAHNIGTCHVPREVTVQGLRLPLNCLWPGQQVA